MLECLHAVTWQEAGIHSGQVTSPPQDTQHSLTPTGTITASDQPNVHDSDLWEGTGQAEENPRRHWENVQTPHTDDCANHCTTMQLQDLLKFPVNTVAQTANVVHNAKQVSWCQIQI